MNLGCFNGICVRFNQGCGQFWNFFNVRVNRLNKNLDIVRFNNLELIVKVILVLEYCGV